MAQRKFEHVIHSPVHPKIDFEQNGKQFGALRVPHSRNDSGWGLVSIPIVQVKNGKGPTVLFTAGNHGDEYEGQVALLNLARKLDPKQVQGRVLMIPAMHLPAVLAGTRTSPIDGRDLNRSFPGDPTGSFAQVLAHYVDTALLPLCDFQMDLHSGGFSTTLEPCTVVHDLDDKKLMNKSLAAVNAFNAPITLILKEPNAGPTLLAAAERRGIPASSSELGGNARVGIPNLAITERGIRNVLKYHGVLDGKPELDPRYGASRLMTVPGFDNYVFAPANGLWQPAHECGATVKAGQVAGWMHFVEQPSRPAVKLVFKASGLLWCMRTYAKALEGDPLCVVAVDR